MFNNSITTLKVWCQKVLPLVYDDSLSYYELLCKVVAKVNEVVESINDLNKNSIQLINEILQSWLDSGVIEELINENILNDIKAQIKANTDAINVINNTTIPELTEKINNGYTVLDEKINNNYTNLDEKITSLSSTVTNNYNSLLELINANKNEIDSIKEFNNTVTNDLAEINGKINTIEENITQLEADLLNKAPDWVNVKTYNVWGDGVHDDTTAIQNAINSNPGKVIFFPKGTYKVTDTIQVNDGTILLGSPNAINSSREYYTFHVYTGLGDLTKPAFVVHQNSGIKGFTFYYPEQTAVSGNTPKDYSYCIANDTTLHTNEVCLEDLCLVNATRGLDLTRCNQSVINYIYGQGMKTFIKINDVRDSMYISNIHIWPFYTGGGGTLDTWCRLNAIGWDIGHCDDIKINNGLVFGCKTAFYMTEGEPVNPDDTRPYGGAWAVINNISIDLNVDPIVIRGKCQMIMFNNINITTRSVDPIDVDIVADVGEIWLNNFRVGSGAVFTRIKGTGARVYISNCFCRRDTLGTGLLNVFNADVILEGNNDVYISNCNFQWVYGNNHIHYEDFDFPTPNETFFTAPDVTIVNTNQGQRKTILLPKRAAIKPCVLEMDIIFPEQDNLLQITIAAPDGSGKTVDLLQALHCPTGVTLHYTFPLSYNYVNDNYNTLNFVSLSYAGTGNTIITNIKISDVVQNSNLISWLPYARKNLGSVSPTQISNYWFDGRSYHYEGVGVITDSGLFSSSDTFHVINTNLYYVFAGEGWLLVNDNRVTFAGLITLNFNGTQATYNFGVQVGTISYILYGANYLNIGCVVNDSSTGAVTFYAQHTGQIQMYVTCFRS